MEALLLFRSEQWRNLAVRFSDRVSNLPTSVAADFFQLRSRFVDDRRNLGHLFVGQAQLPFQAVLHHLRDHSLGMGSEDKAMRDRHCHEHAGRAAGDEYEQETGDQFPLQRAIHGATSS